MQANIQLLNKPLNVQECVNWVMSPTCGGIDVFIGTVRNRTKGKAVLKLDFEAYKPMAISEMNKISQLIFEQFSVEKVLMHHRTGTLDVGDIPVIIAVSAPHRDAAFEACRYIIDTLKQTVPIWKKEFFEDGEVWVGATP